MRKLFVILGLISHYAVAQQENFNPNQTYHPDSLKHWTTTLFEDVSKKRPGFLPLHIPAHVS